MNMTHYILNGLSLKDCVWKDLGIRNIKNDQPQTIKTEPPFQRDKRVLVLA